MGEKTWQKVKTFQILRYVSSNIGQTRVKSILEFPPFNERFVGHVARQMHTLTKILKPIQWTVWGNFVEFCLCKYIKWEWQKNIKHRKQFQFAKYRKANSTTYQAFLSREFELKFKTILFSTQWEHNKQRRMNIYHLIDHTPGTDTRVLFSQKVLLYADRSQV